MARILAVDPGEKRVGLALSDEMGLLASPFAVVKRESLRSVVARIAELVEREGASEVVVGLPVSLSGHLGPQAQRSLRFVEALRETIQVPVRAWNEQYSTAEARRMLAEAGRRPRERRGHVDALAATVLLQDYLDSRR